MCWLFGKKKEITIPEILHSNVKVGAYFDEANDVERWGMMKRKKLHGYGMRAFNKSDGLEFGIFEDDKLKVRMWDVIHDIQEKIGTNSKMITTLVFGSTGAYIGEVLSPAAYHDNVSFRTFCLLSHTFAPKSTFFHHKFAHSKNYSYLCTVNWNSAVDRPGSRINKGLHRTSIG